ncbi:MAG: hypothetical protein M5U09_19935 [Gammaproteobacteria bacterium]|nr:hypothetical protein [Gammaproteobacteria bacterium]
MTLAGRTVRRYLSRITASSGVGDFGSGATIEGLVQVSRNSMLEIVHNSVIDGTVNLYQSTSATMLEATITGDLNIEDSAFEIGSANNSIGGNIWGRSATFRLLGGHTFAHPGIFDFATDRSCLLTIPPLFSGRIPFILIIIPYL